MPRRTASRPLTKGSTFLLPSLTMLGLLLAASSTGLTAGGAIPATNPDGREAPSTSSEPMRFLLIPVTGLVGVDVKSTGVEEAIELARSQSWEAVIFEIDSTMGLLDEGLAIAGQIRLASPNLRTIALVRRVGGAGIPVLFACEEWLVIDEFEIEEKVQYAPSVTSVLGTDRTVIQTLPTWGGSADSVSADLSALRTAARPIDPDLVLEDDACRSQRPPRRARRSQPRSPVGRRRRTLHDAARRRQEECPRGRDRRE